MKSSLPKNRTLTFADLVLNTRSNEVWRGNEQIRLPVLSFELLLTLAESAPLTLTQDQIIERVWKDNVVGDETLKQRVKLLRKSLGDNAQSPKYIGVIRGRGYHLIPNVEQHLLDPLAKVELSFNERVPSFYSVEGMKIWKRMSLALSSLILILIVVLYFFSLQLERQENGLLKLIENKTNKQHAEQISQAYGFFLKGREYYQRYIAEDNQIAISLYQHALRLDPKLAIAYAGLADAYSQGVFQFGENDHWKKLALTSAKKAVELEPNNETSYKA